MSDFINVVRDWRRMCKSYSDIGSCGTCPLQENDTCANIETATDDDITSAEHIIEEWCEKNPEVVYPTWAEWLIEQGVINKDSIAGDISLFPAYRLIAAQKIYKPIPAIIAKKLGIEPKVANKP